MIKLCQAMNAGTADIQPLFGERIDDLQRDGLRILQKRKGFRFGTDAVLLAHFSCNKNFARVVDLGTGTGIVPILMSARLSSARFDAIEIQSEMAEMTMRSILLNKLEARVRVHHMDMRLAPEKLGFAWADLVTCNPPYGKAGGSMTNPDDTRCLARHEGKLTIEQVAKAASSLLKNGGQASFVFPAQRFLQLCDAMRTVRLEPKRVQMVQSRQDKPPHLVLVQGVKNAGQQLHFLPSLVLATGKDNAPTKELLAIYGQREKSGTLADI